MSPADVTAVVTAVGALVMAVTGLVKVLRELRKNTVLTQETHAAVTGSSEVSNGRPAV